jgi:hypothetical protein
MDLNLICNGNCNVCNNLCEEYVKIAANKITADEYSVQLFKKRIIEGIIKNLKINVYGLTPISVNININEHTLIKKLNKIKIVKNEHLSFTIG